MKAGKLNRMVEVWRDMEVGRDPLYNTPIVEFARWRRFWAALVPKSEEERYAASQIYSAVTVVFRCHYFDGLEATDTLKYAGDDYNVVGVRELGYRARLEITAKLAA